MLRPILRVAALLLALTTPLSQGQTPAPLLPFGPQALTDALARPLGAPVTAPRTRGTLDLSGKRFYIAEYRVLVEQSAEQAVALRNGRLLGLQLPGDTVMLRHRAQPDIAALQALVDRAWADLQARLAAAGVQPVPPAEITGTHGAIFEATEAGSTAATPVLVDSRQGEGTRRHLVLAPSGQKLMRQVPGGLDVGNLAARLSYPRQQVEGLSLALAINLGTLEPGGRRVSTYAAAPGVEALSPQMELGPAPQAALVHAHGQRALVNLNEALLLAPEFGRLRLATAAEAARPANPLQALLSLGRSLTGGETPAVDAVLELDGPSTGRLMMYSLQAANQAIADTLQAALRP